MTQPSSNYEALAQYFGTGPVAGLNPSAADVARFIVLNADTSKPLGPGATKGKSDPSIMSRIFDVLSRGNYASAQFTRSAIKTGDPLNPANINEAFKGLTGEKKTTFSQVLKEDLGIQDKLVSGGLGLALDIFADPTTYIPVAGIASKLKGLKKGATAVEDLGKPLGAELLAKGEPINPEAFGLPATPAQQIPTALQGKAQALPTTSKLPISDIGPKAGFDTPQLQLELPGVGKKVNTTAEITPPVEKIANKEAKGQLPLNFPDFSVRQIRKESQSANQIVAKAANADPAAIEKMAPVPQPKIEPRQRVEADNILKGWNPNEATAELNKKFPDSVNAKQQVKLFYRAVEAAKKQFTHPNSPSNVSRIQSNAYKIYTAIEQSLEARGLVPRIGTGENVKLSEVIAQAGGPKAANYDFLKEFGDDIKVGSPVWDVVEALKARGAIDESRSVKLIVEAAAKSLDETKKAGILSDGAQMDFGKFMKEFSKSAARTEGVSPAGIRATGQLVDFALKSGKSRAQIAIEQNAKALDDIVARGVANNKVNGVVTRALEKDLGTLPKWVVNDNNAAEWFMGRVATWWGQKDLRPLSLNAIGSSAATAATRGKVLDDLFKPFGLADRQEGMRLAQGIGAPTSPEVEQLATQIKRMMDNLIGQVSGSSVLLRSGVHMDMLNKWMRRYGVGFEFSKSKKAKDITGQIHDYSKGTDWTNSWKTADIKADPKSFLFKAQQAMEQATREKALFDEFGERFGSKVPGKGYRTTLEGYDYLKGYYFPKEIADQLPRVVRDWSPNNWKAGSPLLQHYDRILSMWKAGVTIYRPGHHIRNLAGDVYLGWMDGVNTLRPYVLATRVQRSMRGVYKDLADVDRLVEMGALSKNYKTPKPGEVLFRNKSGIGFTAEQIHAVAHQKGLLEHANTLEDILDMGDQGRKILDFKPFGGKVQGAARGASELIGHNTRLAHFIDKIAKSRGSDIGEIFEQASRRARKWHPTGLDLTEFEKSTMRRIMPFYTWIRKSTPLLLEGLVMNPGKSVIPAKIMDAIQHTQGIEGADGRLDPFPVDQMFPDWLRASGTGPISGADGLLGSFSNQSPAGYVMGGVGLNPLADLMAQFEAPGKTLGAGITPGIGVPFELLSGTKTFTGEPIAGPDARPGAFSQYVGENIPGWSAIQGITGLTPTLGSTKASDRSDSAGLEALVNFLTAAGIKGTGPYQRQAQYEKFAPGKSERKYGKEQQINELRRLLEG